MTGEHTLPAGHAGGLPPLPHLLQPGLRVVFIGYNPGLESARAGHYYAHRGNVFWRQLTASGLVARAVSHVDDRLLPAEAGIGFVDLCCRPTARASELQADEIACGARRLDAEIRTAEPRFAVFSGRGIFGHFARHVFGLPASATASRPDGEQPERIRGTIPFVIPSSSGLASRWHAERLALLRELAATLGQAQPGGSARP